MPRWVGGARGPDLEIAGCTECLLVGPARARARAAPVTVPRCAPRALRKGAGPATRALAVRSSRLDARVRPWQRLLRPSPRNRHGDASISPPPRRRAVPRSRTRALWRFGERQLEGN